MGASIPIIEMRRHRVREVKPLTGQGHRCEQSLQLPWRASICGGTMIRKRSRTMHNVFGKPKAGCSGWSVKPQEAAFRHMPWTSGVRTSQGAWSKRSSCGPCPVRSNSRDNRSLRGVRRGVAELSAAGHRSRKHRERTQEEARA